MNCFIMKALTLDSEWYEFTLADIPTLQTQEQFVLMNKPGAPILRNKLLRRGDPETGLYEGDVIKYDGMLWLVCYERGFRVINSDYTLRYLYHLDNFTRVGFYTDIQGLPSLTFKKRFLFKYKEQVFRLEDIVGAYEGNLLLRSVSKPVPADEIQQDCGMRSNGTLLYLGDSVQGSPTRLAGGRVVYDRDDGELIDVATGGVLDGYIPRAVG